MTRSFLVAVLVAVPSTSVAMGAASPSPVLPVASWQQDTSTFADSATAALVARARSRRREQDQRLGGYTARVHILAEGRAAWTRFGDAFKLFVYEMTAVLEWQRPNDLRIDVLGARSRSPKIPGMRSREQMVGFWTEAFASEPWFAPRALGDEIEMLGIPEEPAVHPLAPFADRFYRYTIRDSVRLGLPGRTVRAVSVRVEPKFYGPVLVSGDMWLDADSLDLVRLVVTFIGEDLWDDDEDSPVLVSMEADLEYSLHQNAFWLPHRQVVAATFEYKYMPGAVLPATAVTTFSDHHLMPDTGLTFRTALAAPATGRRDGGHWSCEPFMWGSERREPTCGAGRFTRTEDWVGGRWEVNVPSVDSLQAFDFGSEIADIRDDADRLLRERVGDLAALTEGLPGQWVRRPPQLPVDFRYAANAVKFNRVQGVSIGYGVDVPFPARFTDVALEGRFGFGDLRPVGSATLRRDGPGALFELTAFRRERDVEPWTRGSSFGSSMRALFLGHDDADYYLALGGGVRLKLRGILGEAFDLRLGFERQRSLARAAGSAVNDFLLGSGEFQDNPPIAEGDFVTGGLRRTFVVGRGELQFGAEGQVGSPGGRARGWASARLPFTVLDREAMIELKTGVSGGDDLPQLLFRVGGPATVRGYTYGSLVGESFWSVQTEFELVHNDWASPVLFVDTGNLFRSAVPGFSAGDPLVGVGAGLSIFGGWLRIDLSKGVNPGTDVRLDISADIPY
jgi:hypothetical protein